ncbi:MAG: nickel-binding protein [Pseudomonadales bacterium]
MTELILERRFDPPLTTANVMAQAETSEGCFGIYRVDWRQSFLSADGRRLACWLVAPDAESARLALRQSGVGEHVIWPATVHDAADAGAPSWRSANVAVSRRWEEPVVLDDIQAIEDAGAGCLATHQVRFARTYFATDRRRMLCLYQAPDAEAVRNAQRQAGMPVESVWAFRPVRDLA